MDRKRWHIYVNRQAYKQSGVYRYEGLSCLPEVGMITDNGSLTYQFQEMTSLGIPRSVKASLPWIEAAGMKRRIEPSLFVNNAQTRQISEKCYFMTKIRSLLFHHNPPPSKVCIIVSNVILRNQHVVSKKYIMVALSTCQQRKTNANPGNANM